MGIAIAGPGRNGRPLIVEFVGPPGSGKTTIAEMLRQNGNGVCVEDFPYFRTAKFAPFFALNLLWLSLDLLHLYVHNKWRRLPRKRDIALMTILTGWNLVLKRKATTSEQIVILDEGAISLFAKLYGFGADVFRERGTNKWWQKTYEKWGRTLDLVIVLDSSIPILLQRMFDGISVQHRLGGHIKAPWSHNCGSRC